MKITAQHLEGARDLLNKATSQAGSDENAAISANDKLRNSQAGVRAMQGAFDILASSFASGMDLEDARAVQLPDTVQDVIGFSKAAKPKEETT